MPELPEAEIIKRGLAKFITDATVLKATSSWVKSFPNDPKLVDEFLITAKIKAVSRRAKVLILELSSGYSLIVHLKMTGQLVFVSKQKPETLNSKFEILNKTQIINSNSSNNLVHLKRSKDSNLELVKTNKIRFGGGHPSNSLVGRLPDRSTRVVIELDSGTLFFNDQRKFGWMKLVESSKIKNLKFFKELGPEPLESNFTAQEFISRLRRRSKSSIKAVLLDQTVIAGIGNIYADESLWAAKIHPASPVSQITDQQINLLFIDMRKVLELAIKKGGSTDRNYVNAEGQKGSYLSFAKVFRKQGYPCPRCGTTIQKIRVAGRGTHICPKCQEI
jgi:formamidopyrimidine-DNA glycosylase